MLIVTVWPCTRTAAVSVSPALTLSDRNRAGAGTISVQRRYVATCFGLQSAEEPSCSRAGDVSELPPMPTQNAADVPADVHRTFGTFQVPATSVKVAPGAAATYPDQFELTSGVP